MEDGYVCGSVESTLLMPLVMTVMEEGFLLITIMLVATMATLVMTAMVEGFMLITR